MRFIALYAVSSKVLFYKQSFAKFLKPNQGFKWKVSVRNELKYFSLFNRRHIFSLMLLYISNLTTRSQKEVCTENSYGNIVFLWIIDALIFPEDFPLFFIQQLEKKTDCHLVISDYMKRLPRSLHEGGVKWRHKLSSSEDRQLLLS